MPAVVPIDFDAVRTCLVGAVMDACGLDQNHVIMSEPEQPGAPRPDLPYITLKFTIAAMRMGSDEMRQVASDDDGMTYALVGQRACNVSFQSFGSSHEQAYGILGLLQTMFDSMSMQQALAAGNIATHKVGQLRDISALLNTGYEGRAQMDVTFGLSSSLTLNAATIKTAIVQGEISDVGDTPVRVAIVAQGG